MDKDPMAGRIARFEELRTRGTPLMFIGSVSEGHQRMNHAPVGDTASENDGYDPLITAPHGFQVGVVKAKPGNGPAYPTHNYIEAFAPLRGSWRFCWGSAPDKVEGETIIHEWDLISLPLKLWRGFEPGQGGEEGWIWGILEEHQAFSGKDPYRAPQVIRRASEQGFGADDSGRMIKPGTTKSWKSRRAKSSVALTGEQGETGARAAPRNPLCRTPVKNTCGHTK